MRAWLVARCNECGYKPNETICAMPEHWASHARIPMVGEYVWVVDQCWRVTRVEHKPDPRDGSVVILYVDYDSAGSKGV